jgi:hypothetical protein
MNARAEVPGRVRQSQEGLAAERGVKKCCPPKKAKLFNVCPYTEALARFSIGLTLVPGGVPLPLALPMLPLPPLPSPAEVELRVGAWGNLAVGQRGAAIWRWESEKVEGVWLE